MTYMEIVDVDKVEEEVTPTGDGARSERQEPSVLRELDAAVAERVMGEPMPPTPSGCPHLFNTLSPQKAWHHVRDFDHGDGECKWEPEPFSTSVEVAMRAVEKMRMRGYRWNAQTPHGKGWEIRCYRPTQRGRGEKFRGLLPEAICRAALSLVDVNSSDEEVK